VGKWWDSDWFKAVSAVAGVLAAGAAVVAVVAGRVADASQNRPLVLLGHQLVRVRRLVRRPWR